MAIQPYDEGGFDVDNSIQQADVMWVLDVPACNRARNQGWWQRNSVQLLQRVVRVIDVSRKRCVNTALYTQSWGKMIVFFFIWDDVFFCAATPLEYDLVQAR